MGAVQSAGGSTVAQTPESCVVDSMPRIAIERGFAQRVIALQNLASYLQTKCIAEAPRLESSDTASTEPANSDTVFRGRKS